MMPLTRPRRLQDHLDDRRQAVGGAAGVGDDVVLGRVVLVLVDAEEAVGPLLGVTLVMVGAGVVKVQPSTFSTVISTP